MEKFAKAEVNRLVKKYIETKDENVLSELKQFVDHLDRLIK